MQRPGADILEFHEPLCEVYLIVRPEEKYDVEQALQTVMAPVYSAMSGLGRGGRGGLAYGAAAERGGRRGALRWLRGPELAVLLPKTIFYFVIPKSRVEAVVEAAGAVLRMKGGPGDCGLGVAIVGEIESEVVIGPARSREPHVAPRTEPESWHHEGPP